MLRSMTFGGALLGALHFFFSPHVASAQMSFYNGQSSDRSMMILSIQETPDAFPNVASPVLNAVLADLQLYLTGRKSDFTFGLPVDVRGLVLEVEHNLPETDAFQTLYLVQDVNDNGRFDKVEDLIVSPATFDAKNNRILIEPFLTEFMPDPDLTLTDRSNFLLIGDITRVLAGQYIKIDDFDLKQSFFFSPDKLGDAKKVVGLDEFIEIPAMTGGSTLVWHQCGNIAPEVTILSVEPSIAKSGQLTTFKLAYSDRDGGKDVPMWGDFPKEPVLVGLDLNGNGEIEDIEKFPMDRDPAPVPTTRYVYYTAKIVLSPQVPMQSMAYTFYITDSLGLTPKKEIEVRQLEVLPLLFALAPEVPQAPVLPGESFEVLYPICYYFYQKPPIDLAAIPEKFGAFTRQGSVMQHKAYGLRGDYDCAKFKVTFVYSEPGTGTFELPKIPLNALQRVKGGGAPLVLPEAAWTPSASITISPLRMLATPRGSTHYAVGEKFVVEFTATGIPGVVFPADPAGFFTAKPFDTVSFDTRPAVMAGTQVIQQWVGTYRVNVAPGQYPLFQDLSVGFSSGGVDGLAAVPPVMMHVDALLSEAEMQRKTPYLAREGVTTPYTTLLQTFQNGTRDRQAAWFAISLAALCGIVYLLFREFAFTTPAGFTRWKAYRAWKKALKQAELQKMRGVKYRRQAVEALYRAYRVALPPLLGLPANVDGSTSQLERTLGEYESGNIPLKLSAATVSAQVELFTEVRELLPRGNDFPLLEKLLLEQRALQKTLRQAG